MPKYMFKTFDLCIEVSSHILINWSILALARGGLDERHSVIFLAILPLIKKITIDLLLNFSADGPPFGF